MSRIYIILVFILFPFITLGQRINFKPFVQDEGITLTIIDNPLGLNFNTKQQIIVAGDPNPLAINLLDNNVVVIEIESPEEFDLTLEVNSINRLGLNGVDAQPTIPFQLRFAYNNTGEMSDASRRASAIEVPELYSVITFPARRRKSGGPPPPPPTPDHEGYVRQKVKSYIYIYGSLGPIDSQIPAGNYSTTIDLTVNYSDNAF